MKYITINIWTCVFWQYTIRNRIHDTEYMTMWWVWILKKNNTALRKWYSICIVVNCRDTILCRLSRFAAVPNVLAKLPNMWVLVTINTSLLKNTFWPFCLPWQNHGFQQASYSVQLNDLRHKHYHVNTITLLYGIMCHVLHRQVINFVMLVVAWVRMIAVVLLLIINRSEICLATVLPIRSSFVQHIALINLIGEPVWRTLIKTYIFHTTLFILTDGLFERHPPI